MNLARPFFFTDDENLNEKIWREYEQDFLKPSPVALLKDKIDSTAKKMVKDKFNMNLFGRSAWNEGAYIVTEKFIATYFERLCIDKGLISKKNSKYNKLTSSDELLNYAKKRNIDLIQSKKNEVIFFTVGKKKHIFDEIEQSTHGIWESMFNGEWRTFIKFIEIESSGKYV